uniref:Holin of 3TMs, for gene-transfer release n=1 Tax=Candidatus Kentrum sp. UNK TaxID=2126344 RepID=A0A451AMJ8_9GAMM|nr:MAG: hypothetical protein BECKUNK1418G_GA0071005_11327 [Candidatus Kentron sp. UNK]VFK72592.1 MAG: hypothetical protein BECKUNK1418H_GA0071006_11247 [Candidatus Kentron sp. UNK]
MDPITIAMGLAQIAPKIIGWMAGDKAGAVAEKVLDTARDMTGIPDSERAVSTIMNNPERIREFRQKLQENEAEFLHLAAQNANEVNKTMRAETKSEHWPAYSWRPFVGFSFGAVALLFALAALAAYLGVIFGGRDAQILQHLPGMLASGSALLAVIAPVLGIASWHRGKMQALGRG